MDLIIYFHNVIESEQRSLIVPYKLNTGLKFYDYGGFNILLVSF